MAKKSAKKVKKTKKKSKKKVTQKKRKKTTKKRKIAAKGRTIMTAEGFYIRNAKLQIMSEVPEMPCTVIKKDRSGRLFAHTQAEKVYAIYREKCEQYGLVINRTRGTAYEAKRPSLRQVDGEWTTVEVPCVRYEGQWKITHVASGECEYFEGAGDGDNEIWSVNSAQTVAKKCGLLDYFEVAWPQPTDWLELVRNSVDELPPEEMFKALREIIPVKIFEATKIGDLLTDYFNSVLKTHNERKKK